MKFVAASPEKIKTLIIGKFQAQKPQIIPRLIEAKIFWKNFRLDSSQLVIELYLAE